MMDFHYCVEYSRSVSNKILLWQYWEKLKEEKENEKLKEKKENENENENEDDDDIMKILIRSNKHD